MDMTIYNMTIYLEYPVVAMVEFAPLAFFAVMTRWFVVTDEEILFLNWTLMHERDRLKYL